ncbi:MAG TPA: GNAT family N-acetyltransferase [Chthoniobacterales bacterium]|nr:GNAT family N-acetyltransferase [Chthoniobacterales bacterium]
MAWALRLATDEDIPQLETLIGRSVRTLQADYYSAAQMDGALGSVFGVDRQLIRDQTYFVVEQGREIIACGGWSKRESLFGSDTARLKKDALLDPLHQAARIRAFFVHPEWARRGIARAILHACEEAIRAARFTRIELVATLPGVPFYRAFDYQAHESDEVPLINGLSLPVVRMSKNLVSPNQ